MVKRVSGTSPSNNSHILIKAILETVYAEYLYVVLFVPPPAKKITQGPYGVTLRRVLNKECDTNNCRVKFTSIEVSHEAKLVSKKSPMGVCVPGASTRTSQAGHFSRRIEQALSTDERSVRSQAINPIPRCCSFLTLSEFVRNVPYTFH